MGGTVETDAEGGRLGRGWTSLHGRAALNRATQTENRYISHMCLVVILYRVIDGKLKRWFKKVKEMISIIGRINLLKFLGCIKLIKN